MGTAGKATILLLLAAVSSLLSEVSVQRFDLTDSEGARGSYMALPFRIWGSGQYRPDPAQRISMILLGNSRCSYALQLSGKETTDGRWPAAMGMPYPSKANWYAQEFFSFQCGAIKSSLCHVEILECRSGKEQGMIQLRYSKDDFAARVEIILLEDDNRLLFAMHLESAPPKIASYQLDFLCYPSSFGGGYEAGKESRKREAQTPGRTLIPGGTVLLEDDEYWVCFYDKYYDVTQNRGEGPCAILFNPRQTLRAEAQIGDYASSLRLSLSVSQSASLMLWDFNGWANSASIEYMKALIISH